VNSTKIAVLACLLLCAVPARADDLPDVPRPKAEAKLADASSLKAYVGPRVAPLSALREKTVDRKFVAAYSVLALAKITDAVTTVRMLDRGCKELNPLLGSAHPSPQRIAAFNGAYFAGQVAFGFAAKKLLRNRPVLRHMWLINPVAETAGHAIASAHNEALVCP